MSDGSRMLVGKGRSTDTEVARVIELAKTRKPGEGLTHVELMALLPNADERRYRTVMAKAIRKYRRDTGIHLVSELGVGYRIPLGGEQLDASDKHVKKSARNLKKAIEIANMPDDLLPDPHDRERRDKTLTSNWRFVEMIKQSQKELREAKRLVSAALPAAK